MASTPAVALRSHVGNCPIQTSTPCVPTLTRVGDGEQITRSAPVPYHDSVSPKTGASCLCEHSRFNAREANSASPDRRAYPAQGDDVLNSSDKELTGQRERIPTLRPGSFDGSGSWKDFLYQFKNCAKANCWSERTMAEQVRFSLTGAAGAIIHKNPRSARTNYQRIVGEIEAAYGPSSEHAVAIGIELRQWEGTRRGST